ncbi:hypothetical protein GCM10027586_06270 [Kineococcus gypseus]|uniref:hypothetical protein n=1 Tax=Kineococcus gypseus TaxID=1637102 RepID=UPI003D7DB715
MSEHIEQDNPEVVEADTIPAEPQEPHEDGALSSARREAGGYRARLREAEAERDRLQQQLDAYRLRDAEAIATTAREGWLTLRHGPDLWADGVGLADVVDDSGAVDEERVVQAVTRLVQDRPHWQARPSGDIGQGRRGVDVSGGAGWQDVIRARS